MSVTVDLKSRQILLDTLDEDCNFVLQTLDMKNELSYNNLILSSLNFIEWELPKLKILNEHDMIDWKIFSKQPMSDEIFKYSTRYINLESYLSALEKKYKILPDDQIQRITEIMEYNCLTKLANHTRSNKEFYFTEEMLDKNSYILNTFDDNECIKYVSSEKLFIKLMPHLPHGAIKHICENIKLCEESCDLVIKYQYILPNIKSVIFQHQNLSFGFIMKYHEINLWTYNDWINILRHQSFNNDQLLRIFRSSAGETIKKIASEFYIFDEDFLLQNWDVLDKELIITYQPLSYSFIKSNIDKIDMEKLYKNQNLKVKIIKIPNTSGMIIGPTKYFIINNHEEDIVFVD